MVEAAAGGIALDPGTREPGLRRRSLCGAYPSHNGCGRFLRMLKRAAPSAGTGSPTSLWGSGVMRCITPSDFSRLVHARRSEASWGCLSGGSGGRRSCALAPRSPGCTRGEQENAISTQQ